MDGTRLKTERLERRIDEICRGYDGFYFGRFDLRARTPEDFQAGENFKIIELNGVTSESTNIYDPKFSLAQAYWILFRQWSIACQIGAENFKLGTAKPLSVREIAALFWKNRFGNSASRFNGGNPKPEIEKCV